jgi:hypothetical protein
MIICRQADSDSRTAVLLSYSAVVVTIGIFLFGEPIRMPERCSIAQTERMRLLVVL